MTSSDTALIIAFIAFVAVIVGNLVLVIYNNRATDKTNNARMAEVDKTNNARMAEVDKTNNARMVEVDKTINARFDEIDRHQESQRQQQLREEQLNSFLEISGYHNGALIHYKKLCELFRRQYEIGALDRECILTWGDKHNERVDKFDEKGSIVIY